MNPSRRRMMQSLLAGAATAPLCAWADEDTVTELQRGDPVLPVERLTYDSSVSANLTQGSKAIYQPKLDDFGARLLATAKALVGKNRRNAKDEIATMLDLFELPFADRSGKPIAFCAAGISYVAARLYANQGNYGTGSTEQGAVMQSAGEVEHYHFYPSPGVVDMMQTAQGQHRWVPLKDGRGTGKPEPGWLVVFNWQANEYHVGIVDSQVDAGHLQTVEFNTVPEHATGDQRDGGAIAARVRPLNRTVLGYIRTDKKILARRGAG